MRLAVPAVLLFVTSLPACVEAPGDDAAEPATAAISSAISPVPRNPCPTWGCGGNSPILGPFGLEELSTNNEENASHVKLVALVKPNVGVFKARVLKNKLEAVDPNDTTKVMLSGTALIGASLIVSYPETTQLPTATAPSSTTFAINITNMHQNVRLWQASTGDDANETVETYELKYTIDPPATDTSQPNIRGTTQQPVVHPICNNPPGRIDTEGTNPNAYETIMYTGNRYDAAKKLVTAHSYADSAGWFNIACSGGALAKMYLNRMTVASAPAQYGALAWTRQQAMLKMYTGDFCGSRTNDGESFTVQGTPLEWETNTIGWFSPVFNALNNASPVMYNVTSFESYWDENGAICMDTHRLASSSNNIYAGFGARIEEKCPLPACTVDGRIPTPRGGYYFASRSGATSTN